MESCLMMVVRHHPSQHVGGCGVDGATMFESRSTMPVVHRPSQRGGGCGNDSVTMFGEAMRKGPRARVRMRTLCFTFQAKVKRSQCRQFLPPAHRCARTY